MNDLTGKKFGRLTVISPTAKKLNRVFVWHCVCECGRTKDIRGTSLSSGATKSCGCIALEVIRKRSITHGHSLNRKVTKTYRVWQDMLTRCNNPNSAAWSYYGGRGIKVCERWGKFANFLADKGVKPDELTLDRYPDRDGNYEPDNTRWATRKEQANNRMKRRWWKKPVPEDDLP